jgi:hypothetical protein
MSDEISYAAVAVLVLTRPSALGPLNRTGRRTRFVSSIGVRRERNRFLASSRAAILVDEARRFSTIRRDIAVRFANAAGR